MVTALNWLSRAELAPQPGTVGTLADLTFLHHLQYGAGQIGTIRRRVFSKRTLWRIVAHRRAATAPRPALLTASRLVGRTIRSTIAREHYGSHEPARGTG